MELFAQLHQEGNTLLVITHNQSVAQEAQRIIELLDGRITSDSGQQGGGMSLGEAVRSALWSLRSNKLRSFLSMLGIIIGVAAVVGIVSIGLGAQSQVLDMVSALGSNLIMITPAPTLGRSGRMSSDAVDVFTMEMAQHLQEMAPV